MHADKRMAESSHTPNIAGVAVGFTFSLLLGRALIALSI